MTESQREAIAEILERVAKEGMPGARDLDVALDAIEAVMGDAGPKPKPDPWWRNA